MKRTLVFSKKRIEDLEPEQKRYAVYDEGGRDSVKGLRVVVSPTGNKSFQLYRRVPGGNPVTTTLGKFPAMTVQQAQDLALRKSAQMAEGVNPNEEKKERAVKGITFKEAFHDYMTGRKLAATTVKSYENAFNKHLRTLHDKALTDITRQEVLRLHTKGSQKHQSATNAASRVLRAVFNYAMEAYIDSEGNPVIKHNPTAELKTKRIWSQTKDKPRTNVIAPDDMKRWFNATEDRTPLMRDYLQFVILTGVRRREAGSLKWEQVDFRNRCLVFPKTKNEKPLVLPMTDYIHDLLTKREDGLGKKEKYVFPSPESKSGHVEEPKKATAQIFQSTGIKATIHDLRRTFATIASSGVVPVSHYALKMLINHSTKGDVTGNHYVNLGVEQLRQPLQGIEDYILKLAGKRETGAVISIVDELTKQAQERDMGY